MSACSFFCDKTATKEVDKLKDELTNVQMRLDRFAHAMCNSLSH